MATLYEIDNAIVECLDAETGEILDAERLNDLQMEREQKIENVCLWYKNLLSDAAAYKAEKDSFYAKQKAAENKAASLKKWLDYALSGEKYKSDRVNVSYRKSVAVVIDEEAVIPRIYFTQPEPVISKEAIKAALNDGAEVIGAHLEERNNIIIK